MHATTTSTGAQHSSGVNLSVPSPADEPRVDERRERQEGEDSRHQLRWQVAPYLGIQRSSTTRSRRISLRLTMRSAGISRSEVWHVGMNDKLLRNSSYRKAVPISALVRVSMANISAAGIHRPLPRLIL